MTMSLTNTVRRPRGFALRTRLVALWASYRRALRLQREYRYMEELPDRLLEDVGLTRRDVPSRRRLPDLM